MPELTVTEAQLERLETVREDLEAAYVGPYGHVRRHDAVEYLLDTYTPPDDVEREDAMGERRSGDPIDGPGETPEANSDDSDDVSDDVSDDSDESSDGEDERAADPESTLQQAMSLLDAHEDKWRDGSGDEPYEVDLPDGSVEPARTKDDVRRLLFKHHR